jgi:hypothetical protein
MNEDRENRNRNDQKGLAVQKVHIPVDTSQITAWDDRVKGNYRRIMNDNGS